MEAKQETKQTKKGFFKRNIFYFVVAFILIAAITLTVILMVTGNRKTPGKIDGGGGEISGGGEVDDSGSNDKDKDHDKEDDDDNEPVEVIVTFTEPVENAVITCDYSDTAMVYNKTLNLYTGHMAIDFSAPMGTDVKAVYGGVVESVETDYLHGTTVTIDHGNNLKTVYNSIEVDENLIKGKKVNQGDVIGKVSDNNKQEYKDGPHLHFEVLEDGKKISPYKYLTISEK